MGMEGNTIGCRRIFFAGVFYEASAGAKRVSSPALLIAAASKMIQKARLIRGLVWQ